MESNSPALKIVLAAIAVIVALTMSVLIYFRVDRLRKTITELYAEQAGLMQDYRELQTLEMLKSRKDELENGLRRVLGLMPEEPDEEGLIRFLQMKAEAAQVKFIQVEFGDRIGNDQYVDMPLEISVSGEYEALLEFLKLVGTGERAVRIDSMNVSALADGTGRARAEISARGFCQKDGAVRQAG